VGDFSRATHLSVKTLHHYHQVGLLEPATVNPDTGYRYYSAGQIATAQVVLAQRPVDADLVRGGVPAELGVAEVRVGE